MSGAMADAWVQRLRAAVVQAFPGLPIDALDVVPDGPTLTITLSRKRRVEFHFQRGEAVYVSIRDGAMEYCRFKADSPELAAWKAREHLRDEAKIIVREAVESEFAIRIALGEAGYRELEAA